jgi:hypothetical protein
VHHCETGGRHHLVPAKQVAGGLGHPRSLCRHRGERSTLQPPTATNSASTNCEVPPPLLLCCVLSAVHLTCLDVHGGQWLFL